MNGKHELLASIYILPGLKPCAQARIHPIDLEFLDPAVQCLINLLQRAITELVDLIEVHNHLNPISISKCDGSWRINYSVVMLVFKAHGITSRFGEVELSLVVQVTLKVQQQCHTCTPLQSTSNRAPFALSQRQDSRPPSSSRLTTQELVAFFHLILEMNHIRIKDFDQFKCRAFRVSRFEFSDSSSLTEPVHKNCDITSTSDDRIDQAGSGVAGLSSSRGFHQSCRKFTFGIWAFPMSSSSDDYAYASGAISSSICRSAGGIKIDGLSLVGGGGGGGTCEDPEAPDGPAGGGGGS
nr:hypothetical protein [Tanacetum cinerariifolium]